MNRYLIIIPIVLFIAVIYYGAIFLISKKIAKRANGKRTKLKKYAKIDIRAREQLEKIKKNDFKIVKRCFSIIDYLSLFIAIMLIIKSYFEIEDIIKNFKQDGKFILLNNIKYFLYPVMTIVYIFYLAKNFFRKEKDVI